jgi:hypothetical protein
MSQKRHICYYSNRCKWSKAFVDELKTTPWLSEFQFICVDPSPNRPALPRWLKQTPTLVIGGLPEAESIKTDGEVMNWLYIRKMNETPKKEKQTTIPNGMGSEPASWNANEMGGFGDAGYSFTDADTSTAGNGGATIPGNFHFLNGAAAPGDRAGQSMIDARNAVGARSKKEQMFDAQLDQYKQQRDLGLPQGPNRI